VRRRRGVFLGRRRAVFNGTGAVGAEVADRISAEPKRNWRKNKAVAVCRLGAGWDENLQLDYSHPTKHKKRYTKCGSKEAISSGGHLPEHP